MFAPVISLVMTTSIVEPLRWCS